MKLLCSPTPTPYQAPKKKAKKKRKEAKGGLRRKGTSDAVSGETEVPSSHLGGRSSKKKKKQEGGSLPLSPGGAGTPLEPSS